MLFSEHYSIDTRGAGDDWFDPILESDTALFVDPFLIYKDKGETWRGSHRALIAHFDRLFLWLAKSGGLVQSPYYERTVQGLIFKEPSEFCLGYTDQGVDGAGGGPGLAKLISRAMAAAIKRGMQHLDHFELLGIFNQQIGPDRVGGVCPGFG